MSCKLIHYPGSTVNVKDDVTMYDAVIGQSGIYNGCNVTTLGANKLLVAAGRGIIKGREFVIEEEEVLSQFSTDGTKEGRLLLRLQLSNTEKPISFITQVETSLPELQQDEECNYTNGIYEIELATYNISETAISNLKETGVQIKSVNQLNMDLAGMQTSFSGARADLVSVLAQKGVSVSADATFAEAIAAINSIAIPKVMFSGTTYIQNNGTITCPVKPKYGIIGCSFSYESAVYILNNYSISEQTAQNQGSSGTSLTWSGNNLRVNNSSKAVYRVCWCVWV